MSKFQSRMVRLALMFTKHDGCIGLWILIPTIILLMVTTIGVSKEKGDFEAVLCMTIFPILITGFVFAIVIYAVTEWGIQKFRELFEIYPRRAYELGVMKKLGAVARAIGESPEEMVGVAKKRYREFWYAAQAFGFPTFKHLNEHITF